MLTFSIHGHWAVVVGCAGKVEDKPEAVARAGGGMAATQIYNMCQVNSGQ